MQGVSGGWCLARRYCHVLTGKTGLLRPSALLVLVLLVVVVVPAWRVGAAEMRPSSRIPTQESRGKLRPQMWLPPKRAGCVPLLDVSIHHGPLAD